MSQTNWEWIKSEKKMKNEQGTKQWLTDVKKWPEGSLVCESANNLHSLRQTL